MTNLNSLQARNDFELTLYDNEKCIQSTKPEDQGTVNQFWFTSKMLSDVFDEPRRTIETNIKSLVTDGEVLAKSCQDLNLQDSVGVPHKTCIFNLEVLNGLGMCCFRGNQKAREIRKKFNNVLVKEETKQNTLPAVSKEDHLFLNILHAESKEQTVLAIKDYKTYRDEQQRAVEQERDEAIRTKAFISSKREATLMGKVGGTTKALNFEREKNTKLLKENVELIKEKEKLKIRLSESDTYKTIRQMTSKLKPYILTDTKSLQRLGKVMTGISMEMNLKVIKVPDDRYPEVNSYHTEVWRETFAKLNNDPLFLIDIRK